MRRSFVRLTISSVLAGWGICLVIIVVYGVSATWTEERARSEGVFLVKELLDPLPSSDRPLRLEELRRHFSVRFRIVTRDEVERRVGRPVSPNERVPYVLSFRKHWFYVVFADGAEALAAGPVSPALPTRFILPIGLILAIIGLPMIAGVVAVRVERELTKVERASQALAGGELGARVDNRRGPSNELAASFNSMAERIEYLIQSRDELVQAVSHELGSPLSRLRFQMALLLDKQSDDQREQRLNAMTRELDALDDLVVELLGYVQSDKLKLDQRAFDPKTGLNDLAELARLDVPEERAIEIDVSAPEGEVSVFADQRLFLRAVENTLRNAVKHARARVRIELRRDDARVRVAVHDDGPGIPESLREKVMVPFVRLDADRTRKTGGVGLGLAIVSRIVRRHEGALVIDSSPLGGAKVETAWPPARGA